MKCFDMVLPSFLFVIRLNAFTFMPFAFFGTHIFGDKTLQLSLHLPKLIMNE